MRKHFTGPRGFGKDDDIEKSIMEVDGSRHALVFFLWPKWLVMLTEKLRFVSSCAQEWCPGMHQGRFGVMVQWDVTVSMRLSLIMAVMYLFNTTDRSIECMHRISYFAVISSHEVR